MKEYASEIIAVAVAVFAGTWTLLRFGSRKYEGLERRLDEVERNMVTRKELKEAITALEAKIDRHYDQMGAKIDAMNASICVLCKDLVSRKD